MSGNVAMSRASAEGAEYTKNMAGKKKKATFECQACTRKFATRSHLVRHSRVHTGERRYACDYPGCEMRCSRKDNLQQHYRTHLVVNPRRANAQSMLTGASSHDMDTDNNASSSSTQQPTDMAHEFSSEKLTSPADLKPIITGNAALPSDPSQSQSMPESHSMAMNGNHNPLHQQHVHPALGGGLHPPPHHPHIDENGGPERDWSISPPPPLSSAYDYWYAHGCLPQAARNPASVSGSGSSGATSPEISNALELAPGQVPRQYVDSPTTYYHHPPPPSHPPPLGSAYSSYDGAERQQQQQATPTTTQHGYPLATATFPTAADYQHPAAPSQSHPHNHHQRSHSHSYSIGGNSSGGGGYTRLGGYQSASTSPHLPNAHLHGGIHHHHHSHIPHHQAQAPRQHSYDASNATTASTPTAVTAAAVSAAAAAGPFASFASNNSNPRSIAAVQGYHAPGPNTANNSPTDRFSQSSSFHGHPHHQQSHPGHGHSHSHSAGSSHAFQPPTATNGAANGGPRLPARETDGSSQSRPVTRHGSISTTTGFSMPVYPSHPHSGMTTYGGVPVDTMAPPQTTPTSATAAYTESPIQRHSMPVSVASSPRMQPSQQSPSLVLPPIRYADSEQQHHQVQHSHSHSASAYGMMSMGGGHFSSGTPWDRVNVSDARALPPQGHLGNGSAMTR